MTEEMVNESAENDLDYEECKRQLALEAMDVKLLNIIDAETLMNKKLPPKEFYISKLLPQGVSILGGPSKTGKSWMALYFGIQIASGNPVWNHETKKSKVLYLALEDDEARLQSRLYDITDNAPAGLLLATRASGLDDGLIEELGNHLDRDPEIKVIIIDTLQKIRSGQTSKSNVYAQDYKDIGTLKTFADDRRIAILLIHHLRKSDAKDPMDLLNGSTAIGGAADTTMILQKDKRTENTASLFITGRDVAEEYVYLLFNEDRHIWMKMGDAAKDMIKLQDPTIHLIADYLDTLSFDVLEITATDLSNHLLEFAELTICPSVITKQMLGQSDFLLLRGYDFKIARTHKGRKLIITPCRRADGEAVPGALPQGETA